MKSFHKIATGAVLAGTLATSLAVSAPAQAGSKGRKNTTLALGAVAVHQLLTGKTTNGLIAGAGAVVAYDKYKDAKKEEDRKKRYTQSRRYDNRRWNRNRR